MITIISAKDLQAMTFPAAGLQTGVRRIIVRALEEAGDKNLTPSQIATACGLKPVNVRRLLSRMRREGTVKSVTYGKYSL
jgi:hypothetical protein